MQPRKSGGSFTPIYESSSSGKNFASVNAGNPKKLKAPKLCNTLLGVVQKPNNRAGRGRGWNDQRAVCAGLPGLCMGRASSIQLQGPLGREELQRVAGHDPDSYSPAHEARVFQPGEKTSVCVCVCRGRCKNELQLPGCHFLLQALLRTATQTGTARQGHIRMQQNMVFCNTGCNRHGLFPAPATLRLPQCSAPICRNTPVLCRTCSQKSWSSTGQLRLGGFLHLPRPDACGGASEQIPDAALFDRRVLPEAEQIAGDSGRGGLVILERSWHRFLLFTPKPIQLTRRLSLVKPPGHQSLEEQHQFSHTLPCEDIFETKSRPYHVQNVAMVCLNGNWSKRAVLQLCKAVR